MHDVVALLEDALAQHPDTARPVLLRRGQIGVVVMDHGDQVFEVEFAGKDGRAYALLPVHAPNLMVLRDTPEYATT